MKPLHNKYNSGLIKLSVRKIKSPLRALWYITSHEPLKKYTILTRIWMKYPGRKYDQDLQVVKYFYIFVCTWIDGKKLVG